MAPISMTLSDSGGHNSCLSNFHALEFFAYVAHRILNDVSILKDLSRSQTITCTVKSGNITEMKKVIYGDVCTVLQHSMNFG